MIRWKFAGALTWLLGAAAVVPACGREPIDLAARTSRSADGGSDAKVPPSVDAGGCALKCEALSGVCVGGTGKCAECNDDADCDGKPPYEGTLAISRSRCNKATHECSACREDIDCAFFNVVLPIPSEDTWVCDPVGAVCTIPCQDADACRLPLFSRGQCEKTRPVCVECTTEDDCRYRLDLGGDGHCRNGRCVDCVGNGDCGAQFCHIPSGRCEECVSDDNCTAGLACDVTSHRCVPALAAE